MSSDNGSVKTLKLSEIRIDGDTQPRVELNNEAIAEYAELYSAGAAMPPPRVKFDGAAYWLWDGFHRRWAAERAGITELDCEVSDGDQAAAQWDSYSVNTTHGLRRTTEDNALAVKRALRHPSGAGMSDRQIAEHCGVDHKTVGRYRVESESTGEIPQLDSRTGKDGKVRAVNATEKALASLPKSIREGIKTGKLTATDAEVKALAKMPPEEQTQVAREIRTEQQPSLKAALVARGKIRGKAEPKTDEDGFVEPRTRGKSAAKPPKQLDRSGWLKQWENAIGPLVRLVDKIANELGEKKSEHRKTVQEHLNIASEEMAEWLK